MDAVELTMGTRGFLRNERGASAAEFALVIFPFITFFLGAIGVSLLLYANSTLQYAAEDAARCASVKTSICSSLTATQNYALGRYSGPVIAPIFTASVAACGNRVTGTATFQLKAGLINLAVPLAASACFPLLSG